MKAIRVRVHTDLIARIARLPLSVSVWSATTSVEDLREGVIEVTLWSPDFAEVPDGEVPPLVTPIVCDTPARRDWQFGFVAMKGTDA